MQFKQGSILVGYIPPACQLYMVRWSPLGASSGDEYPTPPQANPISWGWVLTPGRVHVGGEYTPPGYSALGTYPQVSPQNPLGHTHPSPKETWNHGYSCPLKGTCDQGYPTNGQTLACENITFLQLRWRAVKRTYSRSRMRWRGGSTLVLKFAIFRPFSISGDPHAITHHSCTIFVTL